MLSTRVGIFDIRKTAECDSLYTWQINNVRDDHAEIVTGKLSVFWWLSHLVIWSYHTRPQPFNHFIISHVLQSSLTRDDCLPLHDDWLQWSRDGRGLTIIRTITSVSPHAIPTLTIHWPISDKLIGIEISSINVINSSWYIWYQEDGRVWFSIYMANKQRSRWPRRDRYWKTVSILVVITLGNLILPYKTSAV